MNKKTILQIAVSITIVVLIFVTVVYWLVDSEKENDRLKAQIKTIQQQPASATIEGPFTVIINHSAVSYGNNGIKIPAGIAALPWTDVNGIKVIDVAMGSTFVRYVEGHIEGTQLSLYAPYLYVDEEFE